MDNKRRSGRALVIQLGKENIRAAKVNLGSAAPQLQATSTAATPAGAVEDGVIRDQEALQGALKNILSAPEFRGVRRVVFSLCTTQVISERVTIPAVPERRLDKLLEANMDMYFPVDTNDYHLVWEVVDTAEDEDGKKEQTIQLWAVPRAIVARYYGLANACGLSVAAIDYCGHSLVSAVGASFTAQALRKGAKQAKAGRTAGRKKEARQAAQAANGSGAGGQAATAVLEQTDVREAEPTDLYLLAEPEHLVMTFVRGGQVRLQRILLRGGDGGELSEARMVLEYYRSMEGGRDSRVEGEACGALADDVGYLNKLNTALGVPVRSWVCQQGPEWCVCLGASRLGPDFGIAEMNHPGGVSKQLGQAWQYAVFLAGAAALAAVVLLTVGSTALWNATLDGLRSSERSLQLQAAQNEGNAQRYYDYESLYNSYSSDWDAVFTNLRTYNDNLVYMLAELETVLPTSTSVTGIGIANEGLGLQFACSSKEEAAYLIIALRNLKYATLDNISDLTVGPGVSAQSMLPSLSAKEAADAQAALLAAQQAAQNSGQEAPPTEGSSGGTDDLELLLRIMELAQASSGSGTGSATMDLADLLQLAMDEGLITEADLKEAVENLTPEQLKALEEAYGNPPSTSYTLDELMETAALEQREAALGTMLTEDPIALYWFYTLFREDTRRPTSKQILFKKIAADLYDNADAMKGIASGDPDAVEEAVPVLLGILTKDEETLTATEDLIRSDESLAGRYAYYLAVEMGLQEKIDGVGSIDMERLMQDIQTGNRPETGDPDKVDEAIDSIVDSLLPGLTQDDINDLLNGGETGDPGNSDGPTDEQLNALLGLLNGSGSTGSGSGSGGLSAGDWSALLGLLNGNGSGGNGVSDDVLGGLLDSLLNGGGGSLFPSGGETSGGENSGGGTSAPADDRIYFSVALGYRAELIAQEKERKGLIYEDKLSKLEVDP